MLIVISPAKTLDFSVNKVKNTTKPMYLGEAAELAAHIENFNPDELVKLFNVSHKLAELNANRYAKWNINDHENRGKAAILAYKGDVYEGMQASEFIDPELGFAQQHLRIISGLYGVLRPLDRIMPYRLDMSTRLSFSGFKNLYTYWQGRITSHVISAMKELNTNILVNLASEEYFKAIDTAKLNAQIITPVFKDNKNGVYKMISFYAKKARGMMSRFIIKGNIQDPMEIKLFSEDGYFYNENLSNGNLWTFTRG